MWSCKRYGILCYYTNWYYIICCIVLYCIVLARTSTRTAAVNVISFGKYFLSEFWVNGSLNQCSAPLRFSSIIIIWQVYFPLLFCLFFHTLFFSLPILLKKLFPSFRQYITARNVFFNSHFFFQFFQFSIELISLHSIPQYSVSSCISCYVRSFGS